MVFRKEIYSYFLLFANRIHRYSPHRSMLFMRQFHFKLPCNDPFDKNSMTDFDKTDLVANGAYVVRFSERANYR